MFSFLGASTLVFVQELDPGWFMYVPVLFNRVRATYGLKYMHNKIINWFLIGMVSDEVADYTNASADSVLCSNTRPA